MQGGKVVTGNKVKKVRKKGAGWANYRQSSRATVRTRFSLNEKKSHGSLLNKEVTENVLICERLALTAVVRQDYWEALRQNGEA